MILIHRSEVKSSVPKNEMRSLFFVSSVHHLSLLHRDFMDGGRGDKNLPGVYGVRRFPRAQYPPRPASEQPAVKHKIGPCGGERHNLKLIFSIIFYSL